MIINEYFEAVDISETGVISKLDSMLRAQSDFKKLSIADIFSFYSTRKDVANLLVGLWSFDFLKNPQFLDGKLRGYYDKYLSSEDIKTVADGLLGVIQCCKIELEEDVDAIDYHYSACGKLYRLLGDKAEHLLLKQLEQKPSIALIDAMGVLAGHQMKGSLTEGSLQQLEKIQKENILNFGEYAKKVLTEDVNQ